MERPHAFLVQALASLPMDVAKASHQPWASLTDSSVCHSTNDDRPHPSWLRTHTKCSYCTTDQPSHHICSALRWAMCTKHLLPPCRDHTQPSLRANNQSWKVLHEHASPYHGRHKLSYTMETENTHDIHGVFDIIGGQGHRGNLATNTRMERYHGVTVDWAKVSYKKQGRATKSSNSLTGQQALFCLGLLID
jgi:hypothetical protein